MRRFILGWAAIAAWACLLAGCGKTAPVPTSAPATTNPGVAAADVDAPPISMMTGTIVQRNGAIQKAVITGKIDELTVTGLECETFIGLMSKQAKADIDVDWLNLEKLGVKRENKLTITMHDCDLEDTLYIALSLLKPTAGYVGYKVEGGVLKIGPQPKPMAMDAVHEQARNANAAECLKTRGEAETKEPLDLDTTLHVLSLNSKIDFAVDWAELANAGLKYDTKVKIHTDNRPVGESIPDLLSQLSPPNAKLAYTLRDGVIWITSQAALDAKKQGESSP